MVKIVITAQARKDLENIKYMYRKAPVKQLEIRNKIIEGYKTLERFPQAGSIEAYFEDRNMTYRSFVIHKQIKLIYYIDNEVIYITGIWDCRQNPLKMNDSFC